MITAVPQVPDTPKTPPFGCYILSVLNYICLPTSGAPQDEDSGSSAEGQAIHTPILAKRIMADLSDGMEHTPVKENNAGAPLTPASRVEGPKRTDGPLFDSPIPYDARTESERVHDEAIAAQQAAEQARDEAVAARAEAERVRNEAVAARADAEGRALRLVELHARRVAALVASWRPTEAEPQAPALARFGELDELRQLARECTVVLSREDRLLTVPRPCKIIGDIHGCFDDMMAALRHSPDAFFDDPSAAAGAPVLFIGDYVDKGPHQLECLWTLLALKLLYPTRVYLMRGNHEWNWFNPVLKDMYTPERVAESFYSALQNAGFGELYNAFYGHARLGFDRPDIGLFAELALGARVGDDVFVVHAGIGSSMQAPSDLDERLWPRSWKLSMVNGNPSPLLMTRAKQDAERRGIDLPERVVELGRTEGEAAWNVLTYSKQACGLLWEVLWSDPVAEPPAGATEAELEEDCYADTIDAGGRGSEARRFGLARRLPHFMEANGLRVLIRGHQPRSSGEAIPMTLPVSGSRAHLITVHTGRFVKARDHLPSHALRVDADGGVHVAVVAGAGAAPGWRSLTDDVDNESAVNLPEICPLDTSEVERGPSVNFSSISAPSCRRHASTRPTRSATAAMPSTTVPSRSVVARALARGAKLASAREARRRSIASSIELAARSSTNAAGAVTRRESAAGSPTANKKSAWLPPRTISSL